MTGGSAYRFSSFFQKGDEGTHLGLNKRKWRLHMKVNHTDRMASVALAVAMVLVIALPTPADALSKRTKNTIGGAVVGAGVGHLVGGNDGAKAGAVVGAIAGNRKKK